MVTVGLISPPDWDDPTPAEYAELTGHRVLQHCLYRPRFSWSIDEIAGFEPDLIAAASALADRGAEVIGIVGTPFGWAGLGPDETPHQRNERISDRCGTPVVSAVSGILDQLGELAAQRVGLAVTYYDAEWKGAWGSMLSSLGYTPTVALSLSDIGLVAELAADDTTHWAPSPDQILANVAAVADTSPDVVIVSGAGARTLALAQRWGTVTPTPVVAADTALYRAVRAALKRQRQ